MSRFWAGASSSDSDSSSESDSDYSSDSGPRGVGAGANRWADLSDSDSDDDEVRVVKSAKERALETFTKHISNLRNHMKNRDYWGIQTEFDELSKAMIKAKKILAEGVPRPLVRILVDLEDDYIPERLADKAAFKKLSARQGRALNRMKLTLKKHNKPYQVVMDHYRKNPDEGAWDEADDDSDDDSDVDSDADSDDSSSESDSDKDDDDKDEDSDDDSDSDDDDSEGDDSDVDWDNDSDEDSESSDEEAAGELKGRARWLKKTPVVGKKKSADKPKVKSAEVVKKTDSTVVSKDHESIRAPKSVIPLEGLTPSLLNKKVKEIASQRGRRGTDPRQLLRQLEGLSRMSVEFGPRIEVPILMYVISAQFGLQRTMDDCMEAGTWRSCATYLERIANVVVDDGYRLGVETIDEADLVLGSSKAGANRMKAAAMGADGAMAAVAAEQKLVNPHTGEPETEDQRAERLRLEAEEAMTEEERKTIPVVGSLAMYMNSLEQEYTKSLRKTSHHTPQYVSRLRDEAKLVDLLTKAQTYFEKEGKTEEAASMAQLRVEHVYYRHDTIAQQVDKAAEFYRNFGEVAELHPACVTTTEASSSRDATVVHPAAMLGKPVLDPAKTESTDWSGLLNTLCTYVYEHGTDAAKTRATICHVFHHALHDRFLEARDLLLMSHLQESIYDCGDINTMILFNRMMVTLGMCAFRQGRIWDAHQCLSEVCSNRVKELLAQGVQMGRFNEKTPEQEKAEKRRQVPYHQHINLDLLEACHLISAMLLEIPNMAAASGGGEAVNHRRNRPISRTFRKYYDIYGHQVFTGPPEQTRDYVMCASKALMKGDWKLCVDLCTNLEAWNLVPGEDSSKKIQAMLAEKIKLEGLRTYLFAFSAQYDSLSLSQLCGMFEMSQNEVHSVVSKMMINRELYASWDQPTETIVLRKIEPNSLQTMALQFAEKAANLVEANERLLDATSGNHGYRDDWKGDQKDDRYGGNRGGGGYQRGGGYGNRGGGFNRRDGGGGGKRGGRGGYSNNRNRGGGGGRGGGGYRGNNRRGPRS